MARLLALHAIILVFAAEALAKSRKGCIFVDANYEFICWRHDIRAPPVLANSATAVVEAGQTFVLHCGWLGQCPDGGIVPCDCHSDGLSDWAAVLQCLGT